MYRYEVWFSLVNENIKGIDFGSEDYLEAIEKAVSGFNKTGATARNPKTIYAKGLEPDLIKIRFESELQLENPSRALKHFSALLIKSPVFKDLVSHPSGKLLKSVYVSEDEMATDKKEMTDEEMLTTLLHWCMSKDILPGDVKKNQRDTIERIKHLINNCQTINA